MKNFNEEVKRLMQLVATANICKHTENLNIDDISAFISQINSIDPEKTDQTCIHGAFMKGLSSTEDLEVIDVAARTAIEKRVELFHRCCTDMTDADMHSILIRDIFVRQPIARCFSEADKETLNNMNSLADIISYVIEKLAQNAAQFFVCVFSTNMDIINYYIALDSGEDELFVVDNCFQGNYIETSSEEETEE